MQPAAQGLLAPQLPPHEARPLAFVRSCRAETVPAQRTAVTIAVSNTVLIFFIMTTSFFNEIRDDCQNFAKQFCCRPGAVSKTAARDGKVPLHIGSCRAANGSAQFSDVNKNHGAKVAGGTNS